MVDKIFKPRRGKRETMISKGVILAKGEMFIEVPDSGVGTGTCKIKMGDGETAYADLPYAVVSAEGQDTIDISEKEVVFTTPATANRPSLVSQIASGATLASIAGAIKALFTSIITNFNITTYTSLGQIGIIVGSETMIDIITKLPVSSRLVIPIGTANASEFPATYGTLIVSKCESTRVVCEFYQKLETVVNKWVGIGDPSISKWTGWVKEYNKSSLPSLTDLGAASASNLTSHTGNVSNPHKVTAAQAGAIPTTGGTVTGEFRSSTTMEVPVRIVRSDKGNNDIDWYQDVYFTNSNGTRTGVIRSQVNSSGNRVMMLGVSNSVNTLAGGISIMYNEEKAFAYAVAPSNTYYGTPQITNIYAGTYDLTAGTSALTNNHVYQVYE